jgi:hypothetical protein
MPFWLAWGSELLWMPREENSFKVFFPKVFPTKHTILIHFAFSAARVDEQSCKALPAWIQN